MSFFSKKDFVGIPYDSSSDRMSAVLISSISGNAAISSLEDASKTAGLGFITNPLLSVIRRATNKRREAHNGRRTGMVIIVDSVMVRGS